MLAHFVIILRFLLVLQYLSNFLLFIYLFIVIVIIVIVIAIIIIISHQVNNWFVYVIFR